MSLVRFTPEFAAELELRYSDGFLVADRQLIIDAAEVVLDTTANRCHSSGRYALVATAPLLRWASGDDEAVWELLARLVGVDAVLISS